MRRERLRLHCGPIFLLAIFCMLLGETGCQAHSSPEAAPSPADSGGPPHGAPGVQGMAGAGGTADGGDQDTVAAVAGVSISRRQLADQLLAEDGAQVLREIMLRIAVEKEAEAKGITITDDEVDQELRSASAGYGSESSYDDAMREQLGLNRDELRRDAKYRLELEQLAIRSVDVSDSEVDRYLSEHQADFGPKTELELSHIVLEDEQQARKILTRLEQGEDFAKLAASDSTDEYTAADGGDLGWIDADDPFTDPAILDAAKALDVGQAAGPIRTESGYEIVQLNGRNEQPGLDAAAARQEARRQVALGKAAPLADLEQSLLDKYQAQVLDPALKP